jgi:quercetin dioxygenase-like cupin family protein
LTDRREAIQRPGEVEPIALAPGVVLRPLVGAHNQARELFTGLATLEPGAVLPYFTRPCWAAVTLLEGEVKISVEGRRYTLRPLDCLAVAPGIARQTINTGARPAVLHIALADQAPSQSVSAAGIETTFPESDEPDDATGRPGRERITRGSPAARFALAPNAMFQDYFNAELGSQGICGGYGLFDPGARLPCHRHDFDESITIVQGRATCVVEGRRYELSDNATALVPRGRCHYYINQSDQPMAMIWVYAGNMPDRIVMDESFCS